MKKITSTTIKLLMLFCCIAAFLPPKISAQQMDDDRWVVYQGGKGPGQGKHIVLVSGDEEYRSEEALPLLAWILSTHHGFKCTVLFAVDPKSGEIDPENQTNIPGLDQLQTADLMVIFTRFRELPNEQMKYIDAYVQAGKPIVGMRTSTHAFQYTRHEDSPYAKYSFKSTVKDWEDGFGRQILGETWIDHHGAHGEQGTRGLINGVMAHHAILRGVKDIWGATDVYGVRNLTGNAEVLVYGQPTDGMRPDAPINWEITTMPVAWIKDYTSENGNTGRVFTTTMGAAIDLKSEDLRRLLVNACYWALGMDQQIPEKSKVDIVGEFNPTMFGFGNHKKGMRPSDFAVKQ